MTMASHRRIRSQPLRAALLCAAVAMPFAAGTARADDPRPREDAAKPPLCCGVPPADEVTANQVFGRWVVTSPGIGMPFRPGERVEFRPDGTVDTRAGPCRFAILRAELTVACAGGERRGTLRFVDDTKLIWRLDGKETLFVAPTD
jgi:hypothetical protein